MARTINTLNALAGIFCEATKEVLITSTGKEVTYSNTIQKIPEVHLRPDIGCFVLFSGDYSGIMISNFTAKAAMSVYRNQMMKMGLPEDSLATEYTADDVVDNIGETINQVIGNIRRQIENQYGLVAFNTQPKAIVLATSIRLTIDSHDLEKELCRRLSFKVDGHSFHIEMSLERTEFFSIDGSNVHTKEPPAPAKTNTDRFESLLDATKAEGSTPATSTSNQHPDFDMLKNSCEKNQTSSLSNDDLDFDALARKSKE